jgi:hypothetical protein
MFAWWEGLSFLQQIFYLIAIPSTLILLIQTIMLLFGLGHDSDTDVDHDLDHDFDHDFDHDLDHDVSNGHCDVDHTFDHDHDHDQGADHEAGLRLLTVRGVVAFLAVCGWVGAALTELNLSTLIVIPLAVLAGFSAMFLVAAVMMWVSKMQQSGNLDLHNAIGLMGDVYVPIPKVGKGKVTLVVQERFLELDASCDSQDLHTGDRIRVVGVTPYDTLLVEPANPTVSNDPVQ